MTDISLEHTSMFLTMFILTTTALFFALKAKKMVTGYRAEFLNAVIYSFLIFSIAIVFHLLSESLLHIPDLALLEHSFILLSFICILLTCNMAMRNKEEWGII